MFVDVRGCSLMVVSVPVKLHRMKRWEDLNLGRCFFSPPERRLHRGVEREQCKLCPILSNAVNESQTVLLPVLLSFSGGRFGGSGFFLKAMEAKEMAWLAIYTNECQMRLFSTVGYKQAIMGNIFDTKIAHKQSLFF